MMDMFQHEQHWSAIGNTVSVQNCDKAVIEVASHCKIN